MVGFTKIAFWQSKKTQNMREILAASGISKTEMNPATEVLDLFKNDYAIVKKYSFASIKHFHFSFAAAQKNQPKLGVACCYVRILA